jgi:sensor histidine kinase YesM
MQRIRARFSRFVRAKLDVHCYRYAMPATAAKTNPKGLARILSWRRVKVVLIASLLLSVLLMPGWKLSYALLWGRFIFVGLMLLLTFGLFEVWPARLPVWFARWALQVLAVAFAVPFAVFAAYSLTTIGLQPAWWHDADRLSGFGGMSVLGLLSAPWIVVAALLRQIRGEAERQALAFNLERSEFERQALDARLRLLQAQIEPHFLFNTLANVRELVDARSPHASSVLDSLIAYLRAAVPRLHEPASTLAQELDLVRAYLEVMHMRMPDRLQFTLHADDAALPLFCPPMTLLTLVENAVRHGIDPAEDGGRVEVRLRVHEGRCHASVIDTGVGLAPIGNSLGTGLANLRERLQIAFGGDAQVHLSALEPHGVFAELDFPAIRNAT